MLPALISAGGSLLGGILGRSSERKAIAAQNAYNDPAKIRERAEAAGFNPLAFIGPGVGLQTATGGTNFFGAALADAGLMLADGLSKRQDALALESVERANADLKRKVESLTLRPKVGGIYAQRTAVPSAYEARRGTNYQVNSNPVSGSGGVGGSASSIAGLPPLLTVDPADPRRAVDDKPISTTSGAMVVDSPLLGRYWFPTIDGDEPVDVFDVPSFAAMIPQLGYKGGQFLSYGGGSESRPNMTHAQGLALRDKNKNPFSSSYNTHKGRHRPSFSNVPMLSPPISRLSWKESFREALLPRPDNYW